MSIQFKKWREETGLSQRDLAEQLGFDTPQLISNVERGLSTYPMNSIKSLAELFGVTERQIRVEMFLHKEKQLRKKMKL